MQSDRHHLSRAVHGDHGFPSQWVADHLTAASHPGARLLDVACGSGRHLRLGLARGYLVTGVDRDVSTLADLAANPAVELIEADLENGGACPFGGRSFEAVVVTNYLWRPLLPAIVGAVAPDGILIYETFAAGHQAFGRPRNPDFLLRPGELVDAVRAGGPATGADCKGLIPIAFEHRVLSDPTRLVQRIVAVGAAHALVDGGADRGIEQPQ